MAGAGNQPLPLAQRGVRIVTADVGVGPIRDGIGTLIIPGAGPLSTMAVGIIIPAVAGCGRPA